MTASWFFLPAAPFRVQGRGLAEDNFAQEERTGLEILIREAFQNPLDARATTTDPVRVKLRVLQPGQFDAAYLASLLPDEYGQRLTASGGEPLPEIGNATVLVLEDFGTTGLEGNYENSNADGTLENWNAFWLREGEGAKATEGSNGRAGQGKITYYRIGGARAVFGLTIRKSDGKRLLMGRSSFRKFYPYNELKYEREAFWCENRGFPYPITTTDELDHFCTAFGLSRGVGEPGLSLVIPFASGIDGKEAMQTIIAEYYVPIARGRLEVNIGDVAIGRSNLDTFANQIFSDEIARQKKSSFTKGFRSFVMRIIEAERLGQKPVELKLGWEKQSTLGENSFPDSALELLRDSLSRGERISIRCPVTVKPKRKAAMQTWFDVHLEVPDELDRVEEAYIRCDLLIGAERHLAASSYLQKARGLTLIENEVLSAFMADAEEPTHLKWNASRPRLAEDYSSPKDTVRAVRQALPRLLTLLSNGSAKQDVKVLAKYFTKPADQGKKHNAGGNNKELNTILDKTRIGPSKPWILIGGPPCQAYSLVGRARNRGKENYVAEKDPRHYLYKEYLRIIHRYKPAVFVMENVKGILSSKINGKLIFHTILRDLENPDQVFGESSGHRYKIHSLVTDTVFDNESKIADIDPRDFIIRAEEYGIPQARHRVILMGIRDDIDATPAPLKKQKNQSSFHNATHDLPRLRSKLSKEKDSGEQWVKVVKQHLAELAQEAAQKKSLKELSAALKKHGGEISLELDIGGLRLEKPDQPEAKKSELEKWYTDGKLKVWLNHETRGHMTSDLRRYAYAATFAETFKRSPKGHEEFNLKGLSPKHANWETGKFSDRFRVQLKNEPATTVTSHIAKDGHYFIHPDPAQCRSLTVREVARLQTFPDNYFFQGNRTQQFHQVGNAVPPLLATQIAKIVKQLIS